MSDFLDSPIKKPLEPSTNSTVTSSSPHSPSSKQSSPQSAAAAADWIKNALRLSPSQTSISFDPFSDFDSTPMKPLTLSDTKSLSSNSLSRLPTFSGSSPLRTKLLTRSSTNRAPSNHLKKDNADSIDSASESRKPLDFRSTFSLSTFSSSSSFSLGNRTSSLHSLASLHTNDEKFDSKKFEAWYTSLLETQPNEQSMIPIIQPPFQAWQATEICGPLTHLHQCMEQMILFQENPPLEAVLDSKPSIISSTSPFSHTQKENQECHTFLDLDSNFKRSHIVLNLKHLLYAGSNDDTLSEMVNCMQEDALRFHLKDIDPPIFLFMLTFRFVLHPCELMQTLIHEFDLHHTRLDSHMRGSVQKNIEKCIHLWLRTFFDDFELCPCALDTLRHFLKALETKINENPEYHQYHRLFCKLESLLDTKLKTDSALIQRLLQGALPSRPSMNIEMEDPVLLIPFLHESSMTHVFQVSVPLMDAVVRCTPLPHLRILSSIKAYFRYTVNVYSWVLSRLEACTSLTKRTSLFKHFLKACHELRELKNFNACLTLFSALQHPWLIHQKPIWKQLKKKYIIMFQEFLALSDPVNDFAVYFNELNTSNERNDIPIPFLVLHLQLSALLYKKPDTQETLNRWVRYLKPLGYCRWALQENYRTGKLPNPEPFPSLSLPKFHGSIAFQRDIKREKKSLQKSLNGLLS